ncbi:hypothetical protein NPIL_546421 [Nephila pilipes]|uniref:Uncharacterized protein n=1 Tax=Nephila pilipes TaxID=299642 RepID=A0A8X6TJB0_NEPPI|nr:hypothetical protein NPIL_619101 [Nephila pilipes]GFU02060.1 hypothetical protein NPIL_546421 [Nephila pilipes]
MNVRSSLVDSRIDNVHLQSSGRKQEGSFQLPSLPTSSKRNKLNHYYRPLSPSPRFIIGIASKALAFHFPMKRLWGKGGIGHFFFLSSKNNNVVFLTRVELSEDK